MPLIAWNYVTPGPRKGSVCKKDVVARPPHLHRPAPHLQLLRRWAKGLEIHVLFAKHSFRCRGKGLHMIGQHETQLHLMTWDVIPYISRSESLVKSQFGQMLIFIVGQNQPAQRLLSKERLSWRMSGVCLQHISHDDFANGKYWHLFRYLLAPCCAQTTTSSSTSSSSSSSTTVSEGF